MNETIIISPHGDDECIGTFEVLSNPDIKPIIIYSADLDKNRREEAIKLKKYIPNLKVQLFQMTIPPSLLNKKNTYYFPNHLTENHPKHREWGFVGEQLTRSGLDVIFYSTEMNIPWKYECKNPKKKLKLMNDVYKSQSDLWKYDHKYWLFSAYIKWNIL